MPVEGLANRLVDIVRDLLHTLLKARLESIEALVSRVQLLHDAEGFVDEQVLAHARYIKLKLALSLLHNILSIEVLLDSLHTPILVGLELGLCTVQTRRRCHGHFAIRRLYVSCEARPGTLLAATSETPCSAHRQGVARSGHPFAIYRHSQNLHRLRPSLRLTGRIRDRVRIEIGSTALKKVAVEGCGVAGLHDSHLHLLQHPLIQAARVLVLLRVQLVLLIDLLAQRPRQRLLVPANILTSGPDLQPLAEAKFGPPRSALKNRDSAGGEVTPAFARDANAS